jgi:hypothetical protein
MEQASAETPGRYGVEHARKKLVQRSPIRPRRGLLWSWNARCYGLSDIQLGRILGVPKSNPLLAEFGWQRS